MAEVLFYHLTESRLEDALPGLVERSLQRGWRAVVQTGSEERRDALDAHFWSYRDESFLAHGMDHDANAEHQPVLLTTGTGNANGASIRFFVDGAEPASWKAMSGWFSCSTGMTRRNWPPRGEYWKSAKAEGHTATYWQQTPDRRWERKA